MGARATLRNANPDAVEVTLTLTMPVKSWRQLRETLTGTPFAGSEGWYLVNTVLADLLKQADLQLWASASEPDK